MTLVDSRFDWAHVLHEFGRVLPAQASISSLSGTVGSTRRGRELELRQLQPPPRAPTVTSATPPGSVPTFTLTGCATSQRRWR